VGTLHAVHEATLQRLALWRERRAARQHQYDALHTACSALERQLGLPRTAARQDLTQAGLDFLMLEQERLTTEKVGGSFHLQQGKCIGNSDMSRIASFCHGRPWQALFAGDHNASVGCLQ
jgi:hypothetical protein